MSQEAEVELAPSLAAMHLSGQLGGTSELWLYRLANWRRPGRASPLEHSRTSAGNPSYLLGSLNSFIGEQLGKQAALAESRASDVQTGARAELQGQGVKSHVRLAVVAKGISAATYAITPSSARGLAAQLIKAAEVVEQYAAADEI